MARYIRIRKQRELRVDGLAPGAATVIEDGAAIERRRDCALVLESASEIGQRLALLLYRAGEAIEAAEPIELFRVTQASGIERASQDSE